jgi:hypothetical protein
VTGAADAANATLATASSDPEAPTPVDVLDRLLARGVLVRGEIWLTVADVELLFVGAHVLIASPDAVARSAAGMPARIAGMASSAGAAP